MKIDIQKLALELRKDGFDSENVERWSDQLLEYLDAWYNLETELMNEIDELVSKCIIKTEISRTPGCLKREY